MEIFDHETVTIETDNGEREAPWTSDFLCEEILVDKNGVLYVESGDTAKAVGALQIERGWDRLAQTQGGSWLGNVHNTGWSPYETVDEWGSACGS